MEIHPNSKAIGTDPCRTLVFDLLHTAYLGVINTFCRMVFWKMLLAGAWCGGGSSTQAEIIEVSLQVFLNAIKAWYKNRARTHPWEVLTRISDMTKKMVGEATRQKLGTKGAETWGVLLFLTDELGFHLEKLGEDGDRLHEAARCLVAMIQEFNSNGIRMSQESRDSCWLSYMRFCDLTKQDPDQLIPKRHLMLHVLRGIDMQGNPRFYSAWQDESNNKILKKCCRQVSQATFELSVLSSMKRIMAQLQRKRRI